MNFPKYKAGPVEFWIAEAFTEFINGFIDGWGAGVGAGGGLGAFTGTTGVGFDMSAINQVLISLGGLVTAMTGAGIQAVYVWHKTHRFPNPWPSTSGTTPSIFPPAR